MFNFFLKPKEIDMRNNDFEMAEDLLDGQDVFQSMDQLNRLEEMLDTTQYRQ